MAGIRVDPEIGRLAIALKQAPLHRLWAVMRAVQGSQGYITREALETQLDALHIHYNRRYLRQLLRDGNGRFWGLAERGRKIFYRSAQKVGVMLVRLAASLGRHELYATNLPGGRDVWLPVLPDLADWEAGIYGAWMAWRRDPVIARDTLAALFGRTPDTFRAWEDRLGSRLHVRANHAQSTCSDPVQLPPHAAQYLTHDNQRRYHWRLPNTYQSAFRVHHCKGSARKRRELAGRAAFGQPVDDDMAQPARRAGQQCHHTWWFDRSHRTERRYHTRSGKLLGMVRHDARAKYPSGIRRQVQFLWRGMGRSGAGAYEYVPREAPFDEISPDWQPTTRPDERVPLRMEYAVMGDYKRAERHFLRMIHVERQDAQISPAW